MAATIYTQAQVVGMLAISKHVPFDDWEDQQGKNNRLKGREGTDEQRVRIKVFPDDESDLTEFAVETCRCVARGEASYSLFGKLLGYPEHVLCRYDLQTCRHTNPKWFPPFVIGSRVLHRHIYNERAIRDDWPWDKCAEPLDIPKTKRKLSFQQSIDRLTPHFLADIKLEVYDPDTAGTLFRKQ